ncbi:MAG: hypothetical protein LKJ75_02445 [Clostridia bacterium]|jgi:Holliday junction resolvase RusA-like endonuclease|nr:hypothetical protein [Clostridia bacterium]MCI2014043.1 hypothetical protein [Clostridia bacterium]
MFEFWIEGGLPTLNEYTKVSRGNKYASAGMKKDAEEKIMFEIALSGTGEFTPPAFITFEWHEKNKRRDKDNVCFAKKFILDALQKSRILKDDGNKYISGFKDVFVYEKKQGVKVTITGDEGEA